ncbi:uncharacterized protein AB9W97_009521 isoform 2-T2 [Spinachia spinachia]
MHINSGLCENLQIARSLCAPCHPQTNGLVEKLNGTIQGALKKMISEERIHLLMANEDVSTHTNNLKEVYHKVEANIAEMQEKVRKRKLAKGNDDSFVVGDKVLRKNIRGKKGGKLETDMLGPYTIVNINGKCADPKTAEGKHGSPAP